MRLTRDQLESDARKMKAFIAARIPSEGIRIVLADGPDGEVWADLNPIWDALDGWDLYWETNCPEWVGLREICEYFCRISDKKVARRMDRRPGNELSSQRRHAARRVPVPANPAAINFAATEDENGLPREVSTADAARILGISKDTVLKLKAAGLLEYRNTAPPDSSRAVYRFRLASVMELRTTYQADVPIPALPSQPRRRHARGHQQNQFKHLRLD